jgi:hypothetical protein
MRKLFFAVIIMSLMILTGNSAIAENIDPADDGHQYAWAENAGWLNFEPGQGTGVTVSSDYITGYVWAENIGWINLSPATAGVTNDGNGNLSGWAWGENVGWISFSCENTSSCGTVDYGVSIDSNSLFDGYAWGENVGWINFKLISQPDYIVETSFGTGDTDMDTIPDGTDNCLNICNSAQLDADADGVGDVCDATPGCGGCGQPVCELDCNVDTDNDGIVDSIDNCPLNCNTQQLDADSDGTGDVCDGSPGCGGGSCGGSEPFCETEC